MTNFLSVNDVDDINSLVQKAINFRQDPLHANHSGNGKRIGLLFLNPSLRTRISTQIAAENLGLSPMIFNVSQDGWSLEFEDGAVMNGTTVEHIKDAAPILGSFFDIIGVRTFPGLKNREEDYSEHIIRQFVKYAGVPVVSLESATVHPLQSLADIITITDHLQNFKKKKPKVVLSWAPHVKALPQCVANSFSEWMGKWDLADFVITNPEGFDLDIKFTKGAPVIHDQQEALKDADFVYAKNWSSYEDYGKVLSPATDWMLTQEKLLVTNDAKIMHCLPVRRNVELPDEILDSKNSLVTEQAKNRVWAAQAVLANILKDMS